MKLIILALALAGYSATCGAQEIKGIKIGMAKAEVEALYPQEDFGQAGFTVAGVRSIHEYHKPITYNAEDNVESFYFAFNVRDFDTVRTALKTKYPKLYCVNSTLVNAMGARFQQVECHYGNLMLSRLGEDHTSSLYMYDLPALRQGVKSKTNRAKADL
jgi:hypothetical protein